MLSQDEIAVALDKCYSVALNGLPKTKTCYELAEEYTSKYNTKEKAIANFVRWQVAKCTTSGFITSVGGAITLPVSIPANLTTVWYIQLRMIATIAIIAGHDPSDDTVQSLAYMCLAGTSLTKICREAGVKAGEKLAIGAIKNVPGEAIKKINQIAMHRFITKFGETGVINLGKMVPVVGGIIGGGFDFVGTHAIAKKAIEVFFD